MPALTAEQTASLAKINQLKGAEKDARALAQVEAKALIDRRMAEARAHTNKEISHCYYRLGVNKSLIAGLGLGSPSDRQAVYQRLAETDVLEPGAEEENLSERGITVELVDSDVDGQHQIAVHLNDHYHPDLGSGLTGSVLFTPEGELVEVDGAFLVTMQENPLWPTLLWSLPVVQAAL